MIFTKGHIGTFWISGVYTIEIVGVETTKGISHGLTGKYLSPDHGVGAWKIDGRVHVESEHSEDLTIQITRETHPEYFL